MRTTSTTATVERLAAQGHLIGDGWEVSDAAGSYDHRYAATGQVQARVGLAGGDQVAAAVGAARAAQPGWSALPPVKRAKVLYRLADLLEHHREEAAELGALDNGTPISVMNPGAYAAAWVRYYAGWCDKLDGEVLSGERGLSFVRLEPYGVVAVIPPWNGSMMGMGQKCAPALAAGNTVVAKPPELAPFGMLRFAELALGAGLPPGVLNVVVGGPEAGAALVGHPAVDKISFTGGSATAHTIMETAARHLTPLALELGGKSPNIILDDADLSTAIPMAINACYLNNGQACIAASRLIVPEDRLDEVKRLAKAAVERIKMGDPRDKGVTLGPLASTKQYKRVQEYIKSGIKEGAELVIGGEGHPQGLEGGNFIKPTVFANVTREMRIAKEEIFGPVLSILTYKTEAEAIEIANDTEFGLIAYVSSADTERATRVARKLAAGRVLINTLSHDPFAPFGGFKQSGMGREGGIFGLQEYLEPKAIIG